MLDSAYDYHKDSVSVTGKRCVELLVDGNLSEGQYVSVIQRLARLEPRDRSLAWDCLREKLPGDTYYQVHRDYLHLLKWGWL